MDIKFFALSLLSLSLISCHRKSVDNFIHENKTGKDVEIFHGDNVGLSPSFSVSSNSEDVFTDEYTKSREDYIVMFGQDSIRMVFSDGAELKFYDFTDIRNEEGTVLETLPPRVVSKNGVLEFPIDGIKNIVMEEDWEEDCNKNGRKCDFRFVITDDYYELAK